VLGGDDDDKLDDDDNNEAIGNDTDGNGDVLSLVYPSRPLNIISLGIGRQRHREQSFHHPSTLWLFPIVGVMIIVFVEGIW
jgi:hypothetical protein